MKLNDLIKKRRKTEGIFSAKKGKAKPENESPRHERTESNAERRREGE